VSKSVNKVILIGRLGRDPELKYTGTGTPFCRFSIATDEQWKDGGGNKQERVEWHNCVVWDKLAEICNQYLSKGSQVYIEGSLQTREWDDNEGNKRKSTEIRVREVTFLGGKKKENGTVPESWGGEPQPPAQGNAGPITDDDIPF
jgi:single-strand DNA-binding protein